MDLNDMKNNLYDEIIKLSNQTDEISIIIMNSIFTFLKDKEYPYSENKNGIFINISCINENKLNDLYNFIQITKNGSNINLNENRDNLNILKNETEKKGKKQYKNEKQIKKEKKEQKEIKKLKLTELEKNILSFSHLKI